MSVSLGRLVRFCTFQHLLLFTAFASVVFLFSSISIQNDKATLELDPGRPLSGRRMSAISLVEAHAAAAGRTSEPAGKISTIHQNTARKETSKDVYVEIFKMGKKEQLEVSVKDLLKQRIKKQGFVVGETASFQIGSSANYNNRTVTEDDIKRTLKILDQKLEEGKRVLSVSDPVRWNTTDPDRILLVTSWRSGSTFLGQILSSHPGVFHHYEPLMHVGIKQIRNGSEADETLEHLKDLLHCRYRNEKYLKNVKEVMNDMISHNAHVWDACTLGPNKLTCSNATFLQAACNRFPIILMKIVRIRLALVESLLKDRQLAGLKVVYLVRDPRATMSSRWGSVKWCASSSDCNEPSRLCEDIDSDLNAFEALAVKYPKQVALLKYETLASEPQKTFRNIFDFAGLSFTKYIDDIIQRHTSKDIEQPWSTVRKSAERINLWRRKLTKEQIRTVEGSCQSTMKRLGYSIS